MSVYEPSIRVFTGGQGKDQRGVVLEPMEDFPDAWREVRYISSEPEAFFTQIQRVKTER
jgi:hypothetical protein